MIWTVITGATWLLLALTFVLAAVVLWKMGDDYERN